ncbi:nuclease-related domain-containing protein [Ureibacillus sp. GCM10028918]|uniref:nuclease-related domain-containing protein n=1 Tax=Ureibacillus sp. GCM10028918 TaxID=3273429 RepID=UPI00361097E7
MLSKILKKFFENNSSTCQDATTEADDNNRENKNLETSQRIGKPGEYNFNIHPDQLPAEFRYIKDILISNSNIKSGYSQIDQVVITPYAIFIIEIKNNSGTINGDKNREIWSVNDKLPMTNPFNQNDCHIEGIKSILEKWDKIQYVSMVSFNKSCTLKVNEELRKIQSNDLVVYDTEFSEFVTRKINVLKHQNPEPILSNNDIEDIYNKLMSANIKDMQIRGMLVDKLENLNNIETTSNERNL